MFILNVFICYIYLNLTFIIIIDITMLNLIIYLGGKS